VFALHAEGAPVGWMVALLVIAGLVLTVYPVLAAVDPRLWPRRRTLSWLAGGFCLLVGGLMSAGLVGVGSGGGYVHHMMAHLLIGMIAPLMLVLAAPVTLLLRALPVPAARRLSRLLSSLPVRVVTEPAVAALLNVGGLWLVYTTAIYPALHHAPVPHAAVHAHVFLTGYLFTVSMISVDPLPHRRGHLHRSLVLVTTLAAHDMLAKFLYARPPAGVPEAEAQVGAMIMYYGGDLVELVIMVIICARWYRRAGRHRERPATGVRHEDPVSTSRSRV
jgi:putative membrane protein